MTSQTATWAAGLVLAFFLTFTGFVSTAGADPSPTGRSPKFLWTPERQAVWNRMKADYDRDPSSPDTLAGQWYKVVKENAECGCRYSDTGLWATLMYQWTGDRKYVELAWTKVSGFIKRPVSSTGGNYLREFGIENVILLDWLWPGLSADRRQSLTDAIAAMLSTSLKANLRIVDSDQLVGTYFAVVLFHLTQPGNAQAVAAFQHKQIGGLAATASDTTTARNAIKLYVEELAKGGEWIESAEYNLGTVNLLLMGSEAVKTATGRDNFPEVTAWTPHWARRQVAFWTPDLRQAYQWGDEEHPRQNRLYAWTNASGLAAGLLQGTTNGAQLQQQLLDLVAKYGAVGYNSMEPAVTGRLFFTFNPYAAAADWRTGRTFHGRGLGLLLQRSGFEPDDSLFAAHLGARPQRRAVDHAVRYLNDFELWRKGEWVITHPRAYGGVPNNGLGTNAVLMHGFSDMPEFKELVASATGDTFAYQAGTTGGAAFRLPYYNPPPVFVHEWTRSLLYVSGSTDTVIVYDRAHVTDPLRLDRYSVADRNLIDRAPSPKQWVLHMPVEPRIDSTSISWTTAQGQPVRVSPLLPAGAVKRAYDEKALRKAKEPGWTTNVLDSELKHHVRMWPAVKKDWDTFLNVVQVGPHGGIQLVTGPGNVEGVRVSRPGEADVLALFNGEPGAKLEQVAYHASHDEALRRVRLRSTGYSVKWTAGADNTEVYIADLDPTKRWNVEVDGRIALPLTPVSSDLIRVTVSGSGTHTLTLHQVGSQSVPSKGLSAPTGLTIVP